MRSSSIEIKKTHPLITKRATLMRFLRGYTTVETWLLKNAKSLEIFHETSGADNPSTKVHELVEYLMDLKKTNHNA